MRATFAKRHEYWNHFVARWVTEKVGGGYKVTGPRLQKIKGEIMRDEDFWLDVITRHGGLKVTPEKMMQDDIEVYNHCLGNFWGMIYQTMMERGLIKA